MSQVSYKIEVGIKKYIEKHELIQKGDDIVVGVSGGADSMALLYFLWNNRDYYHITLKAAHVHHGIREEAENDASYVEEICKAWNIPFYRYDCNVKAIAKEKGLSEEEAGRIERYNFFISLTNQYGKIATAHNMNDQTETLIMRFLRGSSVKGLAGILPKRDNIIRPLLNTKRKDIELYCKDNNISYKNDDTNFMPIYTRNKIRLECIPYIERNINANIVDLLASHAEAYREHESFLSTYTEQIFNKCIVRSNDGLVVDLLSLQNEHIYIKKRVLILCIKVLNNSVKDITSKHIESMVQLFEKQSGKQVALPYGLIAKKQYSKLILLKQNQENEHNHKGCSLLEGINSYFLGKTQIRLMVEKNHASLQKDKNCCTIYIDYDKIKDSLQLRFRQSGDFIVTENGTKTLKKYFIDEKIPKDERDKMLVVADENEIVWILGQRVNLHYYVTQDTKNILKIACITDDRLEDLC